jgi:cytochrome d ubiquinol oxidase subunit II
VLLYVKTDFFDNHFALTLALVAAIVVMTVIANVSVFKKKEMLAFLASGITLVLLVVLLFSGLFPRVMVGSAGFYDILIKDASSSPYTLKTMTWLSLTILPFVLAYTAWTYYVFRQRIKHPAIAAVGV